MSQTETGPIAGLGDADITKREHKKTKKLHLEKAAIDWIDSEVNQDQTRVEVIEHRTGEVHLKTTSHVGVVSLPNGPILEIQPKAPETNLLAMLRYGSRVEASTIDESTSLTPGRQFIEALAALYITEVERVLNQGLHRDYLRTEETVEHLRGQLDVQRQLQRQGLSPTKFECTYDELTTDIPVNRGVLFATSILSRMVRDETLSRALDRHQQQLRRSVTLTQVRAADIEAVELNRLADHYTDLLRLTRLILRSIYIKNLQTGTRASFALLVDMNDVFEAVIERAVAEAVTERPGWDLRSQASSSALVTGEGREIRIRPDVLVRDENGAAAVLGDAKWKFDDPDNDTNVPSNSDIYQVIGYEVAHDVPGILFYPEQEGRAESHYTVTGLHSLDAVEVPISGDTEDELYANRIRRSVQKAINNAV
jgi:5-methylcytosine-specific restriction enzyme subunit McrC